MAVELEFKTAVESHTPIRKRLRQLRARLLSRALETNIHFDTPEQHLYRHGCGVRIRLLRDMSPAKRKLPAIITYKGPLQKSRFKSREEIETTIGDSNEMIRLIEALGFRQQIRFEKRRESWVLSAGKSTRCKVELDTIPRLGTFIEIEASREEAIHAALKLLGIARTRFIRESYVGMLASVDKKRRRKSRRPLIFKFD